MMKKILCGMIAMTILIALTSCTAIGGDTKGANTSGSTQGANINKSVVGQYRGTIKMTKYDKNYILSYLSPKDKKIIDNAKTEEMKNAAMSLITDAWKSVESGLAMNINAEGNITLSLWGNANSKAIIDSDYIVETNVGQINGFGVNYLPASKNKDGYWAAFKDKRNGEMTVDVSNNKIMLINKTTSEEEGVRTYTLNGTISGNKISGTWTQQWDGTEVLSGVFECENANINIGEK